MSASGAKVPKAADMTDAQFKAAFDHAVRESENGAGSDGFKMSGEVRFVSPAAAPIRAPRAFLDARRANRRIRALR